MSIRSRAMAILLLGMLTACQTTQQQQAGQRYETKDGSVFDLDELVAEPADRLTRAKAHTELASAYYELGNMGVALDEARIALKADPNHAAAYNIQGLVQLELRDFVAAEQSFKHGLQLAPTDPDLNHNYGWFHCRTGKPDQALPWFMNAIRNPLYQTPSRTYAVAGRCLQETKPQEAAEYFDRALRADPNNIGALLPYAELEFKRGRLPESRSLLLRYKKVAPEPTPESLWLGVRIERKLGDKASEDSYATQLRRRYPNSPQAQALAAGRYE